MASVRCSPAETSPKSHGAATDQAGWNRELGSMADCSSRFASSAARASCLCLATALCTAWARSRGTPAMNMPSPGGIWRWGRAATMVVVAQLKLVAVCGMVVVVAARGL
jgi:hypothetical protein